MNPSAALSTQQMILSWTLLGVLFTWMIFFSFLALRHLKRERQEMTDMPAPSGDLPAPVPSPPLQRPAVVDLLPGTVVISNDHEKDATPIA